MRQEFNETKFNNYLADLVENYSNPTTDYEKGANDILQRICNEFIADHYEVDDKDE